MHDSGLITSKPIKRLCDAIALDARTQTEIAGAIGIHLQTLSLIKHGRVIPSQVLMQKIADALHGDIYYLFADNQEDD